MTDSPLTKSIEITKNTIRNYIDFKENSTDEKLEYPKLKIYTV